MSVPLLNIAMFPYCFRHVALSLTPECHLSVAITRWINSLSIGYSVSDVLPVHVEFSS